ncbi:uncharacterized protein LOC110232875 [Exaiptasia diaphana]|uniref:CCHC-type domain-containing protein n=1 Tax=Exaiptasia diaphana TaxID=2652724 RepID=A0A913WT67_EXADI|nr:uncharacterized protein LOC110232875 [Exaiptasia diaphana]KXJ06331.1 hypothetical protein AC249_AIPGENE586 [Exaiptasia diaphana]
MAQRPAEQRPAEQRPAEQQPEEPVNAPNVVQEDQQPQETLEDVKRELRQLKESVNTITHLSVENQLRKFMAYATRPLTEFKNFDALELIEALQNVAHDGKHEKEAYYRLVYQTARGKVDLSNEMFRSLLLRLVGDKDHERVFDAVAKVEKSARQKERTRSDRQSDARGKSTRTSQGAQCFYCKRPGHFRANCYKRMADLKGKGEQSSSK